MNTRGSKSTSAQIDEMTFRTVTSPSRRRAVKRVLVVEDEREIRQLVQLHLSDLGCDVSEASDGLQALALALERPFDLVILDLMLPGLDGMEVCRRLRGESSYTPILMLTARSDEIDRVLGLEQGADDYLTKPFSVRELMARVKAIFRRVEALESTGAREQELIEVGGLALDAGRRQANLNGRLVHLTAKEFDLLWHFASHPGRVYTRTELLDAVWGYGYGVYEHTVNSHINRLRGKIEQNPECPRYILTVWGVGYKFADEERPRFEATVS